MEEKNNMPTLEGDKAKIDEFLTGKTSKFDVKAFKRVVLTQLTYDGLIANNKICGFTKEQIANMAQNPEKMQPFIDGCEKSKMADGAEILADILYQKLTEKD